MKTYYAIAGQSIYDVCLQTYGSLDYLYKLMEDNGVEGLDDVVLGGQAFTWDDSLVVDQQINSAFAASDTSYATDVNEQGSVFFVNTVQSGTTIEPNPTPVSTSGGSGQYSVTYGTSFTSDTDGMTVITPLDINGNPLINCDIVQVEKEIKPLTADDYSWDKTTGVLTLLNGNTLDDQMTLFILYSQMVTIV